LRTRDPNAYAQDKAAAAQHAPAEQQSGASTRQGPDSAVVGGLDKAGLSAIQNAARNQGTPPDTTGAIGPNHYVEFVNSKVGVFSRTTLALIGSAADLDTFVGLMNYSVFDPQIQFDPQSQRWFYLTDAINTSTGADYLAFGFSKSADPSNLTSGWCLYAVNTDGANGGTAGAFFDDYPKLGRDALHVTFGANLFSPTAFVTAQIWSYAKPAAGSIATCPGGPVLSFFGSAASPLKTSIGNTAFTPVPANTVDSSNVDYVVSADNPGSVMTWVLAGTAASPTLALNGDIVVTSFTLPANVPQPGSPFALDTSDTRLTQAVAHGDSTNGEAVWTQHTISGPGGYYSAVRWYELLPAKCSGGSCPASALRQQGIVTVSNQFAFNGAISPATDGTDAVINYNVGSVTLLAQIRSQSRNGTSALGTVSSEVLLASSKAADQDFSCFNRGKTCRWGDYAGATPDPSATNRVWGSNQVNGSVVSGNGAQWQTVNFALAADEPPVAAFTATQGSGHTVNFNGTSSSDPDGSVTAWAWNFGDSHTGPGSTISHSYSVAGTYSVTLTVTDSAGNTATLIKAVHVT
jgi:hypothetical protein